jgi:hypothetical protein
MSYFFQLRSFKGKSLACHPAYHVAAIRPDFAVLERDFERQVEDD